MADPGVPAHARGGRRLTSAAATLVMVLVAACGVTEREDLVGRYETDSRRERWTLSADGTCERTRVAAGGRTETSRCEWLWVDRDGSRKLVVTLPPAADSPADGAHRTQYVLAPGRVPGGRITIPLGTDGTELRKVE
jgi:hypothetical protein